MDKQQDLARQIDAILPQTQCTRCTYPSCLDYAKALANNQANINQCPPGGNEGVAKLAKLLNLPIVPLDPKYGIVEHKTIALIDEDTCIGCTLCIKVCPTDAIIGTNKRMHTVLNQDCTGCDLCLPVCPVDCIEMIPDPNSNWDEIRQNDAREKFNLRKERQAREDLERKSRLEEKAKLLKNLLK